MFCPECHTLVYVNANNRCKCPDYKCGYEGEVSRKYTDVYTGKYYDLRSIIATTLPNCLRHLGGITPPPMEFSRYIGAAFDFDVREMVATSLPMKGYR